MQSAGFVCALQYGRAPDESARHTALQLDSVITASYRTLNFP